MVSSTHAFAAPIAAPPDAAPPRQRGLAGLARHCAARVSLGFLLLLATIAIGVPILLSPDAVFQISDNVLVPPGAAHWLGTDDLGRSVLLEVIWGARVSLAVGTVSAVAAAVAGVVVGAVSGFAGGLVDTAVMRITEIFQVMPTFVLAALIVAMTGPGEVRVMGVIAVLAWPQTARVVRAEILRIKTLGYVEAARCLGIDEPRILLLEIIPNALGPVIAVATLTAAYAILLEAALSFFGLTSPDTVSWGLTLSAGQRLLYQAWWLSAFPGLAIFLTALAFNVFGDAVRDALDPRSQDR
jgi:peptide/nickel transport system permease protein